MSNTTISPNMNLIVPTVGVDPGPDWATNINASLSIIDGHDHSSGEGVQINPNGMNINIDLSFQSNNATDLRSSRYAPSNTPLNGANDIDCVYVSGVDLYYNDGDGNQIRITQAGSVAGAAGSITGLTSPASASYIAGTQTFVWQSAVNTSASMDSGPITIRNNTTSSNGVTIYGPASIPADYDLVLPSLPAVTSLLNIDASGNISSAWSLDNVTIGVISNKITVFEMMPTVIDITSGSGTYVPSYNFKILTGSASVGATYTNNGNTYTVIQGVASGTELCTQGTADPLTTGTLTKTSGTGGATLTFTKVYRPKYIVVEMVGGGGGGGDAAGGNDGSDGTDSTFGTALLVAGAGSKGFAGGGGGSVGGLPSVSAPAITITAVAGGSGNGNGTNGGGMGGSSYYGGAGGGGTGPSSGSQIGKDAAVNSGSGGGGAGTTNAGGTGGAAGAYIEALINAVNLSGYAYAVGAGGAGGTASPGGDGGSGRITIKEYYQ